MQKPHGLFASHRVIADAYVKHESLPGEAAWFYDNFHIVSEALREIRTDLPQGYYRRLPKLQDGVFAGLKGKQDANEWRIWKEGKTRPSDLDKEAVGGDKNRQGRLIVHAL